MPNWQKLTLGSALMLALGTASSFAAPTDYDGKWQLSGSCEENAAWHQPAFSYSWDTRIVDGKFSRVNPNRTDRGVTTEDRWSVVVDGTTITANVDGAGSDGSRWLRRYAGRTTGNNRFDLSGEYFSWKDGRFQKTRNCTARLVMLEPAANSLVAIEAAQAAAADEAKRREADRQRQAAAAARQQASQQAAEAERQRQAAETVRQQALASERQRQATADAKKEAEAAEQQQNLIYGGILGLVFLGIAGAAVRKVMLTAKRQNPPQA